MSSSAFLHPGTPPPAAASPRRRWLVLEGLVILCLAGGAGLALHYAGPGPGTPIPRPGPRRYPPSYRAAQSTETSESWRALMESNHRSQD